MTQKIGDDPAASQAISAVANAINRTRLAMDAEAFIEDGVPPDELPPTTKRRYKWPNPQERDDNTSYREALQQVLTEYYEEHGYPGEEKKDEP